MNAIPSTILMAATLMVSACTESTDSSQASNSADTPSASQAPAPKSTHHKADEIKPKPVALIEKGDPNTPESEYTALVDGNQIMFMFYGMSNLPTDYNKLANTYIKDYRFNRDEFAKRDILEAAKPEIDAEIERAKQQRYWKFRVSDSVRLSAYDFDQKAFKQHEISPSTYFNFNHNGYELTFSNAQAFEFVPVVDEEKARAIAKIRNKSRAMTMDVYLYAQGADLSRNAVKAQIMKMVLRTTQGHEFVIKP